MSDDVFTGPDDGPREAAGDDDADAPADEWADVRMTDPDAGEWNVDAVVVDGRVEYVDLRIRPDALGGFVDCLFEDVSDARAERILTAIAARRGLGLAGDVATE